MPCTTAPSPANGAGYVRVPTPSRNPGEPAADGLQADFPASGGLLNLADMDRTLRRCGARPRSSPTAPPPAAVSRSLPAVVRCGLVLLGLLSLALSPAPLHGQGEASAGIERLDRIRIHGEGLEEGGEEFQLLRARRDSLVLVGPGGGGVRLLAVGDIRRLDVRRETGGSHLTEGVLVGTGVGVLGYLAAVGSNDGPVEDPGAHAAVTILPGAVLGAVVGSAIPDREWVPAVEIGAAASAGAGSPALVPASGPGAVRGDLSVELVLHPPGLP